MVAFTKAVTKGVMESYYRPGLPEENKEGGVHGQVCSD